MLGSVEGLVKTSKQTVKRMIAANPGISLFSTVCLAVAAHNQQERVGGYSPAQWAYGARGGDEITIAMSDPSQPSGIARAELNRLEASRQYLEAHAAEKISRLNNTFARNFMDAKIGDIVMYWRKWHGTRGKMAMTGAWRGPARVVLVEPPVNFADPGPQSGGRSGRAVWVLHGVTLLRCHPSQLRGASARETQLGFEQGIPRVMPDTMDDLLARVRRGTYEDVSSETPPAEAWRTPEVERATDQARIRSAPADW